MSGEWVPTSSELHRPNAARVYDYYLGGACNFAEDRAFARKVLATAPAMREAAQLNRSLLRRMVRYCAAAGVRQFLDIGAGIPTVGNTHEVAQRADPNSHTVYVDNEPVAVMHGELILAGEPNAAVTLADLRSPREVLESAPVAELLDLERPIALLLLAVLHHVSEEDNPHKAVRELVDALPRGSFVAVSHATPVDQGLTIGDVQALYDSDTIPIFPREPDRVLAFLDGLEVLDPPGMVYTPQWLPESPEDVGDRPERAGCLALLGRKS